MDWLAFSSEISNSAALNDYRVAKKTIMSDLLGAIDKIMEADSRSEQHAAVRTWTLHRIRGDEILYDDSDDPLAVRKSFHYIKDGLIGMSIESGRGFNVYPRANEHPRYRRGGSKCRAELIAVIRDENSNPLGAINIESSLADDFFGSVDDTQPKELLDAQHQLEKAVIVAANLLSVIYRAQRLSTRNTIGGEVLQSLIKGVETKRDIKSVFRSINKIIGEESPVIFLAAYMCEYVASPSGAPVIGNDTIALSKYHLVSDLVRESYFGDDVPEFPTEILVTPGVEAFNKMPVRSDTTIETMLGHELEELTRKKDGASKGICLQWSDFSSAQLSFGARLLLISKIEHQSSVPARDLGLVFDVMGLCVKSYLHSKSLASSLLTENVWKRILSEAEEVVDVRSLVDSVSETLVDETGSQLGIIYLSVQGHNGLGTKEYYLAGKSEFSVTASTNVISGTGILGKVVEEGFEFYYEKNYASAQGQRSGTLDEGLKEMRIMNPELFVVPLFVETQSSADGGLVMVRDAKQSGRLGRKGTVRLLVALSERISRLVAIKRNEALLSSAKKTYRAAFGIIPNLVKDEPKEQVTPTLQIYINRILRPAMAPVGEPSCFAVYRLIDESELVMVSAKGLVNEDIEKAPPRFTVGKGLTGTVLNCKGGELFVPYVKQEVRTSDNATPLDECRKYWNKQIGSEERFFYGRHVKVGIDNYVLVVIGKRQVGFDPSMAQNVIKEMVDTIAIHFAESLDQAYMHEIDDVLIDEKRIRNEFFWLKHVIKRDSEGQEERFDLIHKNLEQLEERMVEAIRGNSVTVKQFYRNFNSMLDEAASLSDKVKKLGGGVGYIYGLLTQ